MSHVIAAQQAASGTFTAQPAVSAAAVTEHRWVALYRVAGISALLTGMLIPLQIVAFVVWPPPRGEVVQWFDVFQDSAFIGLISFDLAILLEEVLLVPIILAMYVLLRRTSESLMLIAAALWLLSVALFIGSNTGFEMLALSNGYAAAGTEAGRAAYVAAGQAMLAAYMQQGSSFTMGYLLAAAAGTLVGIGMLRNRVFSGVAAWAAIAANILGLGLFLPGIGVMVSLGSVAILIVWYLMVGWRLVRLPAPAGPVSDVA
jgi:hypothetical protein